MTITNGLFLFFRHFMYVDVHIECYYITFLRQNNRFLCSNQTGRKIAFTQISDIRKKKKEKMQNVFEVDDNDVIYKDVVIIGEYISCLEKI